MSGGVILYNITLWNLSGVYTIGHLQIVIYQSIINNSQSANIVMQISVNTNILSARCKILSQAADKKILRLLESIFTKCISPSLNLDTSAASLYISQKKKKKKIYHH